MWRQTAFTKDREKSQKNQNKDDLLIKLTIFCQKYEFLIAIFLKMCENMNANGRFYTDLFGTGYRADTVTLFAGGDDYSAKLRDKLVSELVKDRNFAVMNYEPYVSHIALQSTSFHTLKRLSIESISMKSLDFTVVTYTSNFYSKNLFSHSSETRHAP